eukprot:UN23214
MEPHEILQLETSYGERHVNEVSFHREDVTSDNNGQISVMLESNQPENIIRSLVVNSLEIMEYCYSNECCSPDETCMNGVCIRDLRNQITLTKEQRNRICIIGIWLGSEWPQYLNLTFHSFAKNSDFADFYVFTNMTTFHYIPPKSSIEILYVTQDDFYQRFLYLTDDLTP